MRRTLKKLLALVCVASLTCLSVSGCGAAKEKRTIRIGHNQSTNHPTHIALTAFQDFINEKLGDKYVVEVYPSELLGSQTDMVQLTQTGPSISVWPATPFWRHSARTMRFSICRICSQARRRTTTPWTMRA